jgi:hypothetical protein
MQQHIFHFQITMNYIFWMDIFKNNKKEKENVR